MLIVGYGSIGAAVERRLAGWEVTIERIARHARDGVQPIDELHEALEQADVVVILVPVTDETRHLVNAKFLRSMKDGALLVNAARGPIVDTDALLKELTAQRITAALDVTDPEPLPPGHPLWQAPGPAAHPARGRRHHRGARPRLRGRQGSAGPLRRWRTAAERHRPPGILGVPRLTMGAW